METTQDEIEMAQDEIEMPRTKLDFNSDLEDEITSDLEDEIEPHFGPGGRN